MICASFHVRRDAFEGNVNIRSESRRPTDLQTVRQKHATMMVLKMGLTSKGCSIVKSAIRCLCPNSRSPQAGISKLVSKKNITQHQQKQNVRSSRKRSSANST